MRYWWVNHKQTFRHEFSGNYIWSPKTKRGGGLNPFYETMREVAPGDIVFSYAGGVIQGFGIAQTHCYTSPRPDEFGHIGEAWDELGWRLDVNFNNISPTVRPAEHMDVLAPVLPEHYSPLSEIGHGYQHVYLASVPRKMAVTLAQLMSSTVLRLVTATAVAEEANVVDTELLGINEWEEAETKRILQSKTLADTTRKALIKARIGQGLFRRNVASIEHRCRVTGVTYPTHLLASHIKPWRESTNDERLSGENGLLLTPSIDHLFDRGFISFEDNSELIVSDVAHKESIRRMGVDTEHVVRVGRFSDGQKFFLEHHRRAVFLQARSAIR
jgi:putative restriction endonuclease